MTRIAPLAALLALLLTAAPPAPATAEERRIDSPRFPVFGESAEREAFFAGRAAERQQALEQVQARRRAEAEARSAAATAAAAATDQSAAAYDGYVGYPVRDYTRAPRCRWLPVTGVDRRGYLRTPRRGGEGGGDGPGFAFPRERVLVCRTGPFRPPPIVVAPLPRPPVLQARPPLRGYGRPGFDLNFPRY
ncbi:hypothetical protein GE300_10200 [Rhodobacteraceae bacterium 2CG4]|uniref:Uncharacterized protein n=1 Tax=Halovulum marinum TaxID=2662447 RepID=A0A6L5Z1N2_9RHOB|nr:hypothetical protein [Halovulum marinum]MSU89980.1 hypothetical protein [Halovulum marinum]